MTTSTHSSHTVAEIRLLSLYYSQLCFQPYPVSAPCQLEECIFIDLKASADTVVVDNLKIIPFFFFSSPLSSVSHRGTVVFRVAASCSENVCMCVLDQSIII